MKFIGFLPDKTIITKDSLEELNKVSHIEYILVESKPEKCVPQWAGWPKYSIVNTDGSIRILKMGKYEVIDMDYSDTVALRGRIVTIMEEDSKLSHAFKIELPWHHFFALELLPLLEELNYFGNLKLFLKFKDNEEQLLSLKKKILENEKIISELRIKLTDCEENK